MIATELVFHIMISFLVAVLEYLVFDLFFMMNEMIQRILLFSSISIVNFVLPSRKLFDWDWHREYFIKFKQSQVNIFKRAIQAFPLKQFN